MLVERLNRVGNTEVDIRLKKKGGTRDENARHNLEMQNKREEENTQI